MGELRISDHALVRYIERVKGESLDAYRAEVAELIEQNQDNDVPGGGFDDGLMFVLEGQSVVTVLTPAFRPKRKRGLLTKLIHVPPRNQEHEHE